MGDDRRHAPATLRNRDFILDVLRDVLPTTGVILEIASGSGEHVVHFAKCFPRLVFQPSDPDLDARFSIAAWTKAAGVENVHAPIALDVSEPVWPNRIGRRDHLH
jgi:tRNA G46 methylase TrmB